MIITSFIAAALAAVTGVSTIRAPGGNQQQVETKPACACEFAVSEIANYELFMRNMRTFARVGERSTDSDLRKAANVVSGIYSEMRFASFVPERVTLYNVYQTKEKNSAFYQKPKAFPIRYEEVFRYSMISFSDKAGVDTASFIVGDSTSFGSVRPNADVTVVNPFDGGMRKETVAKMVDCFVTGGLTESSLLKFYVDYTAEDLLYLDPDDFAPIEVIDFFEIMYGGIHPTDGNHDDDWWLWYEEWLRLQNIIWSIADMEDVSDTMIWLGGQNYATSVLGGVLNEYKLENTMANQVLNATQVSTSMQNTMAMDYSLMLQLNDITVF